LQGMINSISDKQMKANLDQAKGAGTAKIVEKLVDWWLS